MKPIKVKSTGLAIVSSFFALLGAVGYCAAKDRSAQTAALILGFSSATTGIVSINKSRLDEQDINDKIEKLTNKLTNEKQQLDHKLQTSVQDNSRLQNEIIGYQKDYWALHELFEKSELEINTLQAGLNRATEEIKLKERSIIEIESSFDTRFQEYLKEFVSRLIDRLYNQCQDYYPRIERDIRGMLNDEDFENIHPQLQTFLDRGLEQCQYHLELISELSNFDVTTVNSALDASLAGQELMKQYHQIIDEICSFRVRYRNLLNLDERLALKEWDELKPYLMKKPDAIKAVREQANFDKDVLDQLRAKVEEQGKSISEDMTAMLYDLEKAHERIAELSAPIHWKFSLNHATKTGNIIIQYAQSLKIHLDRSHYTGDAYEVDLYFFTDRINAAATIDVKALNDEGDRLAQLTHCLEPIKFTYEYETRLLAAHAVLLKKPKRDTTKQDIDKLWIPSERFENFVRKWERIRITAGSTGGKSPTAKNLALAIMKSRNGQGTIKLHDPQHGSKKDYWNMPKVGTSHQHNLEGMSELCELIETRRHGSNHPFVLYIFDEVDNTVSQLKEGVKFRDLIKVSLKEGSHANVGVIYIGQSSDANEVPGMTHSNWNNAIQLHIGSNAGAVLETLKTITTEDKEKLLIKYRKIQEYCDRLNEELGLDIMTDAGAYRFALVVPLTGLPQFIQLPAFDSYDYSSVMQQQDMPVKQFTEIKPEVETKISCPNCKESNYKKNGTTRTHQKYTCKHCGKPFKVSLNSNYQNIEQK